ncbi:MAG: nucleoside recognition protein [Clostridiales bacterium]|jgi:spore maturation protein A|nr:nucleoside recognition protein [Clostridiales bacterium]
MLNILWAAMILIGVVYALVTNRIDSVTSACINSSAEAVAVCIKMAGIVAFWSGIMRIGEKSGLVSALARRCYPVLKFLFPTLNPRSKAMEYISANFIANILGLGWAATPPGLLAMEELQKINPDKKSASREMCMFLIINMSSLQLITVNILAYRSQYNSANPSEIIGPGIAATLLSSIAAIVAAKVFERATFGKAVRE